MAKKWATVVWLDEIRFFLEDMSLTNYTNVMLGKRRRTTWAIPCWLVVANHLGHLEGVPQPYLEELSTIGYQLGGGFKHFIFYPNPLGNDPI